MLKESKYRNFKYLGSIQTLQSDKWKWQEAHRVKGVYLIVFQRSSRPIFLKTGTGGWYKEKDPNICIERLEQNWVSFKTGEDRILYIGKAGRNHGNSTIKSRIHLYMRFGKRLPVAHWGGRYIWQMNNSNKLEVYYREDIDPRGLEQELIRDFRENHNGRLPFANLRR